MPDQTTPNCHLCEHTSCQAGCRALFGMASRQADTIGRLQGECEALFVRAWLAENKGLTECIWRADHFGEWGFNDCGACCKEWASDAIPGRCGARAEDYHACWERAAQHALAAYRQGVSL